MKLIAHRGNLCGANPSLENYPSHIMACLKAGYDAEVDVWFVDGGLYLGHGNPDYKIDRQFLQNQRIWVHCKNPQAYDELSKYSDINCFFQSDEDIVLTSRGYLWAHEKCKVWDEKTIVVNTGSFEMINGVFGICSDYVGYHDPKHSLPFDLLIIDIDGVMTDGTKIYDLNGKVSGKRYCDLDFTAIKRFKAAGIEVVFLSGDKNVNQEMAAIRKITFFNNIAGVDKVDKLPAIKKYYEQASKKTDYKIAYIGDDYYDMAIMSSVDFAFCPKSSPAAVVRVADVIDRLPGYGVIAELYDMFENEIPYAYPIDSPDVN